MSERTAAAVETVARLRRDRTLATSIIVANQDTIRFTVPDRGHNSAGPETMRYAWSGTPGDPLTHRYNAGDSVTFCEDVHDFSSE